MLPLSLYLFLAAKKILEVISSARCSEDNNESHKAARNRYCHTADEKQKGTGKRWTLNTNKRCESIAEDCSWLDLVVDCSTRCANFHANDLNI